jgi:exodeoxyribonuclease-3
MRIVTLNCNGIRAAARKGFYEWARRQRADVICLQETKAQESQLDPRAFRIGAMHACFHDAQKKGYSGVALYSRCEPDNVHTGIGWPDVDAEGRFLQADFGKLSIVSVYVQSGTSGDVRQQVKYDFLDRFLSYLKKIRRDGREYILCGDWNIAHTRKDIRNWRSNQKHSGFLPGERAWLDTLFDRVGFVDVFRRLDDRDEQYTWWSNRGRAWEKNVGWRIDYQIATPGIAAKAVKARIFKDKRFSDHAPLIIDYDHEL